MTNFCAHSRLKILLADDNEANCFIALTILERAGHSVVTVRTGDMALKMAELTAYDLIILDVSMPVMDGLQALHRIRLKRQLNQNTLIFAFSAYSDADDWLLYQKAGFDGALSKPLRSGDLESALASLKIQSSAPVETSAETYPLGHVPLVDQDIVHLLTKHSTPESLQEIQFRFWASVHLKCRIIKNSLPSVLDGDDIRLTEFRKAVHSVKRKSDSIGLSRVAHISRNLQNSPLSEIRGLMGVFITALSESRPALERALSGARELNTAVQMGREDQPKAAHNS